MSLSKYACALYFESQKLCANFEGQEGRQLHKRVCLLAVKMTWPLVPSKKSLPTIFVWSSEFMSAVKLTVAI